jgi:uncharacterized membrane protein
MAAGTSATATSLESAGPAVHRVPIDAGWDWIAKGWADLARSPLASLAYGAVFAGAAWLMTLGLGQVGLEPLILMLAGGFMLIGPFLAGGLYALSRSYEDGRPIGLGQSLAEALNPKGQLGFFAAILSLSFLAWVQVAFLLLMLVLGNEGAVSSDLKAFLAQPATLRLILIGTPVGAIIAGLVFAASAISAPLLLSRDISAVTAMATSMHAVLANKRAMLLWAAIIVALMVLGFLTMFLGLVVVFPLIGHATWHAMRDMVDGQR